MTDVIIISAIVLIIASAVGYIIWAKKSGKKCIGCPEAKSHSCSGSCRGCNGSCDKM